MKKLIWLPVAGFLLIAGAAVAAAAPTVLDRAADLFGGTVANTADGSATTDSTASEDSAETDDPNATEESDEAAHAFPGKGRGPAFLDEALAELVDDGTLTQAQADAIRAKVQAKVGEKRAEMRAKREQMRETAQKIREFLQDGEITQAEIDQLPADSPLREIWNSIAEDGTVTLEQLRELRPHGGRGIGRGWGWGRFDAPPGWSTDDANDADEESN